MTTYLKEPSIISSISAAISLEFPFKVARSCCSMRDTIYVYIYRIKIVLKHDLVTALELRNTCETFPRGIFNGNFVWILMPFYVFVVELSEVDESKLRLSIFISLSLFLSLTLLCAMLCGCVGQQRPESGTGLRFCTHLQRRQTLLN